MNKFSRNLAQSGTDIRSKRSEMLGIDAKNSQEELVRVLNAELLELDREEIKLTDLYPESEFSLMVTKEKFDAATWVAKIQTIRVAKLNKRVELKVAQDTYDEWFADEPALEEGK